LPYYALSREISYPLADQNIVVNLKSQVVAGGVEMPK